MTIQTVFDKGDQVFYLKDNTITSGFIKRIIVHVLANSILTVNYWLEANNPNDEEPMIEERKLFSTKEQVRKSL